MRTSPVAALTVLAAYVRAYPKLWLTRARHGSCGQLISQGGQSGMGGLGYTYVDEKEETIMLVDGVATFITPSGNWLATATSGTFGGSGSSANGCDQFRFAGSGGTTVTWTPSSGSFSGSASLEIGHASGYATVSYYTVTVSGAADPPSPPPPSPSPPPPSRHVEVNCIQSDLGFTICPKAQSPPPPPAPPMEPPA